jgi:hypothetical protein
MRASSAIVTRLDNRKIMRLIQLQMLAVACKVSDHSNPSLVLGGVVDEVTISLGRL